MCATEQQQNFFKAAEPHVSLLTSFADDRFKTKLYTEQQFCFSAGPRLCESDRSHWLFSLEKRDMQYCKNVLKSI